MLSPFDVTENHLVRAEGLARALSELAREYSGLCCNHPDAHAITTLIDVLGETITAAGDAHGAEPHDRPRAWPKPAGGDDG